MKRSAFFLVIVVVCFAPFMYANATNQSAAETNVSTPKGANVRGPAITFESTTHDFSNVNPASNLTCEFKFTNTGDSLLEITDVRATCGCTVPTLDKKEYAPGETGIIKVNFAPGVYTVPVTKQIHVVSNDAKEPELILTLKANVVKKVLIDPDPIMLSLKQPNAGCPDITLTSLDGKAFAITNFQSSPDCMRLDFDPNYQSTKFVLKPVINVEKLKKSPRGTINLTLSHPDCSEITALFDAPAMYKTDPPTLLLFNAEPPKPITRDKVWLLSNYNEDFQIESTSSKNGFIKVATSEKVGPGRYAFNLLITPPKLPNPSKATNFFTDTFVIKIKGGEQVEIACRGYYAKQKTAAAKP
jgi:hypothetical protein